MDYWAHFLKNFSYVFLYNAALKQLVFYHIYNLFIYNILWEVVGVSGRCLEITHFKSRNALV